jgi:hypothetical protein
MADHILKEFSLPEFLPALGGISEFAARMSMPKASMNENHRAVSGKNDVGFAWKSFQMQPEPETQFVQ